MMMRFLSGVVIVTLAGLLYVHQEVEAAKLGYSIRKKEQMYTQLLDRNKALQYNIARFKAPDYLEHTLLAKQVLLNSPAEMQIVKWKIPEEEQASSVRLSPARRLLARLMSVRTAYAQSKTEAIR